MMGHECALKRMLAPATESIDIYGTILPYKEEKGEKDEEQKS